MAPTTTTSLSSPSASHLASPLLIRPLFPVSPSQSKAPQQSPHPPRDIFFPFQSLLFLSFKSSESVPSNIAIRLAPTTLKHTYPKATMPISLLPASAAAFAPRSNVNVVLASKAEPWLTQTLKRVNRVKRPLNSALEGLEEEGAGELLEGRGEDVKSAIMGLFLPLLPPPPRIVDVVRPAPLLPSSTASANWWVPTQQMHPSHSAPVDAWRVVPSTPSPTIATCGETGPSFWSTMGTMGFEAIQLPSPTPSFSQPYNSTSPYAQSTSPYAPSTSPYTSSSYYSPPPASAPIPALPLPSVLAQQCGSSAVHGGFGGFGWDTGFAPQYAAFT
ncbi:hypothetical protein COCC4DRAFT_20023 [Bipolaris maydis ATCC 48331]|uniref:Uncharacterized protein n=1 Tax=Cochliobolus heterostrophus (strain C4 / ATCC 48331 / race T) TaxID=665024 RepID=N4XSH6_COCH4|nr:uncharacterized protein COCC4DRAFT_20023 [Bipolaris maydis ATCC 48331]ENI09321.1 hypothetical protein COCC4DRAFT_20023 [Bipolaris maydis ATCC 48331]